MKLTRRVVIAGTAVAAASASMAGLGWAGLRELYPRLRKLASPELPDGAPGPLSGSLRRTLLAVVESLLPGSHGVSESAPDPYLRLLEVRAETIPGYRELYRRFERSANGMAREAGSESFVNASLEHRREILESLCPAGRLGRLTAGLVEPDRARFRLYLAREILELWQATGAWPALGFGTPPGRPRGLRRYTRAPAGESSSP